LACGAFAPGPGIERGLIMKAQTGARQLIDFLVGDDHFGLDILSVKEVIRLEAVTALPKAPTAVKGVINLRGKVIPLVELREKFGLPGRAWDIATRVIIVDIKEKAAGLIVDGVSHVVRFSPEHLKPAPAWVAGLRGELVQGVVGVDGRFIVLLNPDVLFSGDELANAAEGEKMLESDMIGGRS
jgi:purine-binding chemotaxis protein CheW